MHSFDKLNSQAVEPDGSENFRQLDDLSAVYDISRIDGRDVVAVKAALHEIHPFSEIFSDEGINDLCQRGQGAHLLSIFTPQVQDEAELTRLREWIENSISPIWEIVDLEERAWAILTGYVYGSDEGRRALIESVKDAGIIGALAQANLQEPMPRPRKGWPSWYRPFRPSGMRGPVPNLFTLFSEG